MIKNLEVQGFEPKVKSNGVPYWRFQTNEGWIACFDKATCEELKALKGKFAEVETKDSNYKNHQGEEVKSQLILSCKGEAGRGEDVVEVVKPGVSQQEIKVSNKAHTTMYVSYGKDLINNGMTKEEAVNTIQYLREAFE